MISYAQNGEDVVLARALSSRDAGFYIDVGAHHPVRDSVTKHFYDLGWRGVNIEPVEASFRAFISSRPRDVNLNVAIGRAHGMRRFYVAPANPGLSSFSADLVTATGIPEEDISVTDVAVRPLSEIFDAHVSTEVDFLKIDAEGSEDEILQSFDLGNIGHGLSFLRQL